MVTRIGMCVFLIGILIQFGLFNWMKGGSVEGAAIITLIGAVIALIGWAFAI